MEKQSGVTREASSRKTRANADEERDSTLHVGSQASGGHNVSSGNRWLAKITLRQAYMAGRCYGLQKQGLDTIESGERLGISRGRICEMLKLAEKFKKSGVIIGSPEWMAYLEGKAGTKDKKYQVGYWRMKR